MTEKQPKLTPEEKLREQIDKILEKYSSTGSYGTCIWYGFNGDNWKPMTGEIMSLVQSYIKEDGYVQLDEDQSLPHLDIFQGQTARILRQARFRKIKENNDTR